jgi:predicted AlkP superfamily pyrophosphatase or phosphodiesterase
MKKLFAFTLALTGALSSARAIPVRAAPPIITRPKLVVLLVIDQFRADYLLRHESRFKPAQGPGGEVGGFEYLMRQGAYYPMAEYGILQSMTCPGHATVLTGAYPYQAGIPLNYWFDEKQDRNVYCAEDTRYKIVGAPDEPRAGKAPTLLAATTVGDELKNAGLASRVVTVALKDRAAIMMGGHRADLALWMDGHERRWVSSDFYLPDHKLPDWVNELNREIQPKPGQTIRWEAKGPGTGLSDPAYVPVDDGRKLGKSFPHAIEASRKEALSLPYGLELTEQAAERAIDAYHLGQGKAPDLLAVSFSSHDYIGHAFGPNSREIEEMTVNEDRLIAKLLNHLRKRVPGGLGQVVVALTGDHGTPPDPDWASKHRFDAGMIRPSKLDAKIDRALIERFGEPHVEGKLKWIAPSIDLNFYVNRHAVADRKVELATVEAAIKEALLASPGIAHAVTAAEYELRRLPPGQHGEQLDHTYFRGRSGDVIGILKPYWMSDEYDEVAHMTGYNYDRRVPLAIAGPGIRPGLQPGRARVIDLAPTLSHLLAVLPPSLSEGRVLTEALVAGHGVSRGTR